MSWDAQPPSEPPQQAEPTGYDQYGRPIVPPQPRQQQRTRAFPQEPTRDFRQERTRAFPQDRTRDFRQEPAQTFRQQQEAPQWYAPQPDPSEWNATQAYQTSPNPDAWAQPQYGEAPPTHGAPPRRTAPPPKRSRTGLYVGLGAGALVVAGVIAAVAAMSGGSPGSTPAADGGAPTTTAGPGSGTSTPNNVTKTPSAGASTGGAQGAHTLGVPQVAGPLHLLVNGDTQQRINDLKKNLQSNTAYPNPQIGFYRTGSTGSFSVWLLAENIANASDFQTSLGMIGPAGVMKQITAGASMKDVTVQNAGPLGGALDCGKLNVNDTDVRSCVWVDNNTFGWVYFLPSVAQNKLVSYTLDLRAAAEH